MRATRPTSIRRTLLLRLLGPLLMLMVLAGAASYGVARHISEGVLDQWLYDSAVSLANRIHWEDGGAIVDLPKGAREILEWDVIDRVFYEVVSLDGKRITGNAFLPAPPKGPTAANGAVYYLGDVNGEGIRALALTITSQDGHTVIVKSRKLSTSETIWRRRFSGSASPPPLS
jgi:two-component system sensor histidine kinase TctE